MFATCVFQSELGGVKIGTKVKEWRCRRFGRRAGDLQFRGYNLCGRRLA